MSINSSWRSHKISGVIVSVLAPSAVDSGFEHNLLGFSAKHAVLNSKSKNQVNGAICLSTRGLLLK
jgi:hypothetical protein